MQIYKMPPRDTPDVWERLLEEQRPLVVWGMGNGADKLLLQFEKYGLTVSDFMASDGFVRGQSFHGYPVLSLSQIEEKYGDFAVVVAFATHLPDVMESIRLVGEKHPLYIPDLPVAGETYFTSSWYREHYDRLAHACGLFEDAQSQNLFRAILTYKLSGHMGTLLDASTPVGRELEAISPRDVRTYVDCGAYNGDTLREVLDFGAPLTHAICIEPDPKTYKRLLKYTATLKEGLVTTHLCGVWDKETVGVFHGSGNRNSSLVGASYEHKEAAIPLTTVDSLVGDFSPDYIKYDVEGVEREALLGTARTLNACHPRLLVSLYHRTEDLYVLPTLVKELYPGCRLSLYRRPCLPAWEIGMVVLPPATPKQVSNP